jgi:four helix bundle protein
MGDFRKQQVWQRAHDLVLAVHATADGIRGRQYSALRSQMVRAAASIDANIVEGSGQRSDKEFMRFLNIATNSANELESHLILAHDLKRAVTAASMSCSTVLSRCAKCCTVCLTV